MRTFKPSRELNSKSELFGLGYIDLVVLTGSLLVLMLLNEYFKVTQNIYLVILMFVVGIVLAPIRLKFRRSIFRDFISYQFASRWKYK